MCAHTPDDSALLLTANPRVVCEEDGVIRDDGVTGWEDALDEVVHHVQNAIVDKQVINKELDE